MSVHIYGIANCDSIKKARKWLAAHDVDYSFHDYKKEGIALPLLEAWSAQVGWEVLLNKRGTTWRKLPDADKEDLTEAKALALLQNHSSMIKRPVLVDGEHIEVGFSDAAYGALFS